MLLIAMSVCNHKRLMLSINGVCEICWESNGTISEEVRRATGQLHLLAVVQARPLSWFGHIVLLSQNRCQEDLNSFPLWRTGGDHFDILVLCE